MFDSMKTLWGLCWEDGNLISRGDYRDVVLLENVTKDQAVTLAQELESPSVGWVRIEL